MRRLACLPVLALLLGMAVHAQQRQQVDISTLGPQVGSQVPDFRLIDQNGTERTLQSLMGPRGLMLVFVRSADW